MRRRIARHGACWPGRWRDARCGESIRAAKPARAWDRAAPYGSKPAHDQHKTANASAAGSGAAPRRGSKLIVARVPRQGDGQCEQQGNRRGQDVEYGATHAVQLSSHTYARRRCYAPRIALRSICRYAPCVRDRLNLSVARPRPRSQPRLSHRLAVHCSQTRSALQRCCRGCLAVASRDAAPASTAQ